MYQCIYKKYLSFIHTCSIWVPTVYFYYTCSPVGVAYTSTNFDLSRSVVATLNYCGTHLQITNLRRAQKNIESFVPKCSFKHHHRQFQSTFTHIGTLVHAQKTPLAKLSHHVTTPAPSLPPPNPHPSHPPMPHLNFSSTDQF